MRHPESVLLCNVVLRRALLHSARLGGKQKGKGVYYGEKQTQVVVGVRQRKGPLYFIHTEDAQASTLKEIIQERLGTKVE